MNIRYSGHKLSSMGIKASKYVSNKSGCIEVYLVRLRLESYLNHGLKIEVKDVLKKRILKVRNHEVKNFHDFSNKLLLSVQLDALQIQHIVNDSPKNS